MSHVQVRLLTAPPGSMPGRDPRRPPLAERLRLEPDDCWDPVPTQLLQKWGCCGDCCDCNSVMKLHGCNVSTATNGPANGAGSACSTCQSQHLCMALARQLAFAALC